MCNGSKIFLIALLTVATAYAQSVKTFSIKGKIVAFVDDPDLELMISKTCARSAGTFSCDAYAATKTVKLDETALRFFPGNPHVIACENAKGQVVLGNDSDGNENSFCQFQDGSLIDNGSLFYYAQKNSNPGQ